jgi:hypothetical protein
MNVLALELFLLGILGLGTSLIAACVLLIIRKTETARKTMSFGILFVAVLFAVALLSFLEPGKGYSTEAKEHLFVLMALSLLLAGSGQFLAALQGFRTFLVALWFGACSMLFLINCGRAPGNELLMIVISLLLAVVSLIVPVFQRYGRR